MTVPKHRPVAEGSPGSRVPLRGHHPDCHLAGTRLVRRAWLTGMVLLWGVMWGGGGLLVAAPPNVLLIVSEDNGPELGCYGDPYARTPHLDRLASQGVRFERAFVPQAGCSQSRASLLTGLHPHQHGQIGLATWGYRLYRADLPNLPRSLREAGYRTGLIGKLHINPDDAFPFDFRAQATANFARKRLGDYTRHAERFFTEGDQPFFLSVNFPDAHDPWPRQVDGLPRDPQVGAGVRAPPALGIDPPVLRELIADYYNSLSRLDSCVGDLLAALDRSGKAQNTLVIYLGDHGADLLRSKRTCYDGGLRIPLLLRWPGRAVPQVRNELVSTLDVLPTLLEACGAHPLPGLPGQSLQPLLATGPVEWRQRVYAEWHTHGTVANYHPQRAVRTERYKLIENLLPERINPDYDDTLRKLEAEARGRGEGNARGSLSRAVAEAPEQIRAGYGVMERPPRFELYDLRADPHEFRNLASDPAQADVLRELTAALAAWRAETRDPLLDPVLLEKLSAEVAAVSKKAAARDWEWGYPDYFFGREPRKDQDASPREAPARKRNRRGTLEPPQASSPAGRDVEQ